VLMKRKEKKAVSFFECKQGSIQDLIFIGVIILAFAMSVLIGFKLATDFDMHIQNDTMMPNTSKTASTQFLGYFTSSFDNVFLFVVIGLALATLAMAALVPVHPIFLVFYIIGLIITIVLSAIFSNIYNAMASNSQLVAQANQLTNISFIIGNLPFIIGIFGILLMAVMYKVWRVGE